MPDAIFDDPRLAQLYDPLDPDRAVTWLFGDATSLRPLEVDAAFMTGNVAQVFLTDDDWATTLLAIRAALRPTGDLVFETRDPPRRAPFRVDGLEIESMSTLRFRERTEIEQSLAAAGYAVAEVRDAPDRPGRGFVFIARRAG